MAVVVSILSIIVLAVLLHLILYFGFKIDARQLLVAATMASLVIVFLMMVLYRYYNLSPTLILLLLFLLAVISALVITFGEQYFALFPHKRAVPGARAEAGATPEAQAESAVPELGEAAGGAAPGGTMTPLAPVPPPVTEPILPVLPLPEQLGLSEAPGAAEVAASEAGREAPPQEAAGAPAPAAKDEEEIARLMDEGYDRLNDGDYRGALESFQLAIVFVDDMDILAKLRVETGRLWFMLDQPSMARTELQEALRISRRAENQGMESEIRQLLDEIG